MKLSFEKKIALFFLIIFALMLTLGFISYRNDKSFKDSSRWVTHTHNVLTETEVLLSMVKDLQIATRGYALTSDSSFVAHLLSSQYHIQKQVDVLQNSTRDNRQQQARIDTLRQLIQRRIEHSFATLEATRRAALTPALTIKGEVLMDQIKAITDIVLNEENRLLMLRNEANRESIKSLNLVLYILLAGAIIFVPLGFLAIKNYLNYRRKVEERIKKLNETLETRVEEKAKAIIEQEKRYHFVLDTMHDGVQIIGFDWKYLYVNDALAKQGKYSAEELTGHSMPSRYPGIEGTKLFQTLRTCMDERKSQRVENEFTYPDGSVGYFNLTIQPVPEGLFVLSVDISERKKRESERDHYIKKLEEVLFKISHEVRHPVVQILGVSELIEQAGVPEEDLPMLVNSLKQSAVQLDSYTRDLTSFVTTLKNNSEKQLT